MLRVQMLALRPASSGERASADDIGLSPAIAHRAVGAVIVSGDDHLLQADLADMTVLDATGLREAT
jgi:hypothetical protein